MIRRLHLEDWRVIIHYLGMLILVMAFSMVIPILIGLVLKEYDAVIIFFECFGATLLLGAILIFAKVEQGAMHWKQALMVTGLSWIVLSFIGTVPLWMSGHYASFLDAFFEGVSGLTASGFTLVLDIDHMAYAFISWRFLLHLMGGIGVLVIALALGLFGTGAGVASLYTAEARADHVMPEIKQTSRFIARVSAVVIVIGSIACFIPMLIAGQAPLRAGFNAVWTTISAYATGGMQGSSAGIMYYHSWPLEVLTMLIMFFGIINFVLYGEMWRGSVRNFFKDIEIRTLVLWMTLLMVLIMCAITMSNSPLGNLLAMLRRPFYIIISAATNTGFSTVYPGQLFYVMGSGAFFVIILAMVVGGSASSTTGGIKAFRVGIIVKAIFQTIREALAPDSVRPRTFYYHQGRKLLSPELASMALTIFLMYVLTFAIGSVIGILCGNDALPAIFDAVSAGANAGLSSGIITPGMPVVLEVVYIIEMLLGRLEFIALFATILQLVIGIIPEQVRLAVRRKDGR